MQLKNIEVGSAEWLALRKSKITATDASSIMGLNPHKRMDKWWQEKNGLITPFQNEAMKRGTLLEPLARAWYIEHMDIIVDPGVYVSDSYDFMLATVDGVNFKKKKLIEIKSGKKSYQDAKKGKIAPYYICQMQHQMAVLGDDWLEADFVAYSDEEEPIIMKVKRDQQFIDEMIEKEWSIYYDLVS